MLHVFVIAAIFIPYVLVMASFGAYIWGTGRPRDEDDRDPPGPALQPAVLARQIRATSGNAAS